MNTISKSRESSDRNKNEIDIDQWIKEVKPQLLAALQRRGRVLSVYISPR